MGAVPGTESLFSSMPPSLAAAFELPGIHISRIETLDFDDDAVSRCVCRTRFRTVTKTLLVDSGGIGARLPVRVLRQSSKRVHGTTYLATETFL